MTVDDVDGVSIVSAGTGTAKDEEETSLISKATEATTFFKTLSLSAMVVVPLLVAYRWREWAL